MTIDPTLGGRTSPTGRISWLERSGGDFPYYAGNPVMLTSPQWLLVMASVVLAFAILIAPIPALAGPITQLIPATLFALLPLLALMLVAGRSWTALFRPLRPLDWLLMVGFAMLNIIVALAVGSIIIHLMSTNANPAVVGVASLPLADRILFFAKTLPQLLGEEICSILPFLALLYLFVTRLRLGRKTAMVLAALLTGLLFAAAHLPTYGWNIPQAVLGVGIARLVLLLPYIMTKNIWVSTGAHVLNDWFSFGFVMITAGGAASSV